MDGPLSQGEPIPGQLALEKEKRALPGATSCRITFVTALKSSWRLSLPLQFWESEANSFSISQGWSRSSSHPGVCLSHRTDWPMFICCWHGTLLSFSHQLFMFEFLLLPRTSPMVTPSGLISCAIWRPSQHIVVLLKPLLDYVCFQAGHTILLKKRLPQPSGNTASMKEFTWSAEILRYGFLVK